MVADDIFEMFIENCDMPNLYTAAGVEPIALL